MRKGALEAPPRLDRRADDDELGSMSGGDASDVLAEASGPGTHDLPPDGDAIRAGDRRCRLEPLLQPGEPAVHVCVQRQLALDDKRSGEDDASAAVGGEATGEIERVLGLLPVEQRHDDAAVRDRARPARDVTRPPMECPEVGPPHRMSW